MSINEIRVIGDPVLRVTATEITEITENLALLTQGMLSTMYAAPGIGLAAPQIGVQKRLFNSYLESKSGGTWKIKINL